MGISTLNNETADQSDDRFKAEIDSCRVGANEVSSPDLVAKLKAQWGLPVPVNDVETPGNESTSEQEDQGNRNDSEIIEGTSRQSFIPTDSHFDFEEERIRRQERRDERERLRAARPKNEVVTNAYLEHVTAKVTVTPAYVVEGTPIEKEPEEEKQTNSINTPPTKFFCRPFFLCLAVLLGSSLIGGIAGVSVWATGSDPQSPTPAPTEAPTLAPTSQMHSAMIELLKLLQVPNSELLEVQSSPQHKAAQWLAEEDLYYLTEDMLQHGTEMDVSMQQQFLERYALVVLYYSTQAGYDTSWSNNCGFLGNLTSVCEWNCEWEGKVRNHGGLILQDSSFMGVTCCEEPGYGENCTQSNLKTVQAIQLVDHKLGGTIPVSELKLLSSLETLNLAWNSIGGSVDFYDFFLSPSSSLRHILLIVNQLRLTNFFKKTDDTTERSLEEPAPPLKTLQLSWKEETDLHSLDYGTEFNQIGGSLPTEVGLLANLEELYLEYMDLTGSLPSEIGLLTSLSVLSLSYNELTGSIPNELNSLVSLEILRLHSNPSLSGSLNELCELESTTSGSRDFMSDCEDTIQCSCCNECF
eukprot:Nitzschia sp. Nitz4//scaffold308_size21609//18585//20400//NITZ4_008607-RA/size21609-augustus-gene-0.45-mRNA-1//-1//CDS//3329547167//5121//frame0